MSLTLDDLGQAAWEAGTKYLHIDALATWEAARETMRQQRRAGMRKIEKLVEEELKDGPQQSKRPASSF